MATASESIFQIREGMTVYDRDGSEIGSVDEIHFGDEDPLDPGPETVTSSYDSKKVMPDWVTTFQDALFEGSELPQELRERLMRYGYINIDSGFFDETYVTLDKVEKIDDDGVHLNMTLEEMKAD